MTTQTNTITEKTVQLTHGKTRYFEAGSGYPLILVHGASIYNSGAMFAHIMPALAERHRVLSPDCLNWGTSDIFNQEFSFAYLVDHIREFMDALGIEKTNMMGHSMGGWIATLFAYESPDRLNKVILSAAGGTEARPLTGMVEWKPPSEEAIRKNIEERELPPEISREKLLKDHLDQVADPERVEAFGNVMRHMTNGLTRTRYNTKRRLAHIKVPTLVIWGTEDKTNNISMAHDLHENIKGSKLVTIEGAGHLNYQDNPQEWLKGVLEFLG